LSSYTRQALEKWLKEIPSVEGKVLDIGGSQNPVEGRIINEGEGTQYKILDLKTPHETKVKPDIVCDLNRGLNNNQQNVYYQSVFDIAFCLEVSEYWWNPVQALNNINFFLKKGGIFYISFHFVYMIHSPKGLDFLRYTPDGVEKLLKETGFEILEHKYRLAENGYLIRYYEYDKMRGIKDNNINHNVIGSLIKVKKM